MHLRAHATQAVFGRASTHSVIKKLTYDLCKAATYISDADCEFLASAIKASSHSLRGGGGGWKSLQATALGQRAGSGQAQGAREVGRVLHTVTHFCGCLCGALSSSNCCPSVSKAAKYLASKISTC